MLNKLFLSAVVMSVSALAVLATQGNEAASLEGEEPLCVALASELTPPGPTAVCRKLCEVMRNECVADCMGDPVCGSSCFDYYISCCNRP
ncbi:hypothetical protein [Myxococcus qinghaiensis]|uniref:hypothetical protein n=1 Tax=Myxococcus qinghaiensis TaxID=2906758 RepID=UPI0020A783B7|nr:hypothetical protein [Myxococcus qinghaiensis]MCP3168903.1 hypothetical protein [Myxococcus qinghaiensis]